MMKVLAHLCAIAANIGFGVNNIYTYAIVYQFHMPVAVFVLYRSCMVVLIVVAWTTLRGEWRRIASYRDAGFFLLIGVFGLATTQVLYSQGMKEVGPKDAACYSPLTGIFTAMLAVWPWQYERPSGRKAAGVLVGFFGVTIMIFGTHSWDGSFGPVGSGFWAGNAYLLGSAILGSMVFLWIKPLMKKYSIDMILAVSYSAATLTSLVMAVPDIITQQDVDWWMSSRVFWLAVIFNVVVWSIAFWMTLWSSQHLDASISSSYSVLQPVATYFFISIENKFPPAWHDYMGCFFLLVGLALVSSRNQG